MDVSGYKVQILGGRHFSKSDFGPEDFYLKPTSLGTHPWLPRYFGEARGDYVEMRDKEHYKIKMSNHHSSRCTAKVTIDGKYVGTWIIEPHNSATIERPVDMEKKFTFYKKSGEGFATAGLKAGDPKNGLVQVEFTPELHEPTFSSSWHNFETGRPYGINTVGQRLRNGNYQLRSDPPMPKTNVGPWLDKSTRNCFLGASTPQSFSTESSNCCRSSTGTFSSEYEEGGTALRGRSDQYFRRGYIGTLDHSRQVKVSLRLVAKKYDNDDYDRITPLGGSSNPVPPPIFS